MAENESVIANLSRTVFNLEGAKRIAALYIDTSERIAKDVLDFQASASEWARETPLGPVFDAQNELGRKVVERSAEAARRFWQLGDKQ